MWPISSKSDPFFQVWPIFVSVSHFSECDPFFQILPIFPSLTHFSKSDHFSKTIVLLYAFFQMWPILPELTYVFSCKWHIFLPVTQVWYIFGPIFQSVTQFFKCNPFFQEWRIFPSVTHLRKNDPFSTRDPFLQLTSCYAIIGGIYLSPCRVSRVLLGGTG